jgi:hypothetical protein
MLDVCCGTTCVLCPPAPTSQPIAMAICMGGALNGLNRGDFCVCTCT